MLTSRLYILFSCTFLGVVADLSISQQEISPLPEWLVFSRRSKVDIQILKPSGIQVWTKFKPTYLSFGVELYVNPTGDGGTCDLCQNVSQPVDGKFIIYDKNVQVKLGDTIKYRVMKVKANEVKLSPWKTVFVDAKLFFQPVNLCSSQCEQEENYSYVRFLEEYLHNMLENCGLLHTSELLFFPMDNAPALVNDPERFVKSRLYSVDLLRPLTDRAESFYIAQDGVGFKMRTVLDKLKVLELGRDQLGVVDFDEYIIVPSPSTPHA